MPFTAPKRNQGRLPGKVKLALTSLTAVAAISFSVAGTAVPEASAQAPRPASRLEAPSQPQPRPPQLAFGLTTGNALVRFDTANPGMILGRANVRGLQAGETLVGIDFRPANNALYGVGSTGRLYTVDPASGLAQQIGSGPLPVPVQGTAFGVDVNPVPDRLRVVSTQGLNLRINMDTLETLTDGGLAYAAGDRNAGQRPAVVGAAYTNNVAGATATMLYVVDAGRLRRRPGHGRRLRRPHHAGGRREHPLLRRPGQRSRPAGGARRRGADSARDGARAGRNGQLWRGDSADAAAHRNRRRRRGPPGGCCQSAPGRTCPAGSPPITWR
jgi:hypothetical protein